jgi:2-polyprenyl-6-methoxyphenol hydroxylase-like FAD-dependent oxidoreductase
VIYEGREGGRDEAGSFLGLAPNGRDVLATLGIREQIEVLGIPTPKIAFHNHKGKQLGLNPQRCDHRRHRGSDRALPDPRDADSRVRGCRAR